MRIQFIPVRWILLFASLVFLIVGIEIAVVQSTAFGRQPDWISLGVTLDLAVGVPVLYYAMIMRRLKLPIRSLLTVFGLALGLVALILPATSQQYVSLLRRALMLAELGFVGYLLLQIRKIVRRYELFNQISGDFIDNVTKSLHETIGHSRFNRILVSELAVLRYGLLGWKIPVEKTEADVAFSSHRKSGQVALTIALLLTGLIETVVVHLLLNRWNPVVAWFATIAGFYGLLFFVADLMATIKRPVLVSANQLRLRFGLRSYGVIDRQQIKQIAAIREKPVRSPYLLNGTFLTTPNVLITLQEPVTMTGLLGRQTLVSQIALFIDDKSTFIHKLTA